MTKEKYYAPRPNGVKNKVKFMEGGGYKQTLSDYAPRLPPTKPKPTNAGTNPYPK